MASAPIEDYGAGIAQIEIEVNFLAYGYLDARHKGKLHSMVCFSFVQGSSSNRIRLSSPCVIHKTCTESYIGRNASSVYGKKSFESSVDGYLYVGISASDGTCTYSPVKILIKAFSDFYTTQTIGAATFAYKNSALKTNIQSFVTMVIFARRRLHPLFADAFHLVHLIDEYATVSSLHLQGLAWNLLDDLTTDDTSILQVNDFGCLLCHQTHA